MSLRHALLGLLADHPASGYDLTRSFEASLRQYAWHARHSQIYPELNKLADQGLVTVVEEGARGRRTYDITTDGRAELRRWMLDIPERGVIRHEYVLRMFLLNTLEPAEACTVLEQFAETAEQEAKHLRDAQAQTPPESALRFGQLAAEFRLRYFQMQRDWARWAIGQLKTVEQTRQEQPERRQSRSDAVVTS
jgi:PadR family transcriptional regulator AphA